MWSNKDFRDFAAQKHKEFRLQQIEAQLEDLQREYQSIITTDKLVLSKSPQRLKHKLQWDDKFAHKCLQEYRKKNPSHKMKIFKQISSIFESLVT